MAKALGFSGSVDITWLGMLSLGGEEVLQGFCLVLMTERDTEFNLASSLTGYVASLQTCHFVS